MKPLALILISLVLLLPNGFAAFLSGIDSGQYTTQTQDNNVTFTLKDGNIFLYSEEIKIGDPSSGKEYFLVIPVNTDLMPCTEPQCFFADKNSGLITFDSSINTIFLKGGIHSNGFDLYIESNVIASDSTVSMPGAHYHIQVSGNISTQGKNGENGIRDEVNCIVSAGKNGTNSGNLLIEGKLSIAYGSSLLIVSSGSSGGNGVNGVHTVSCNEPDGTNGGNAGTAGNIEIKELVFERYAKLINVHSGGGNGGTAGEGIEYDQLDCITVNNCIETHRRGINGLPGNASSGGNTEIKSISYFGQGSNIIVLGGTPQMAFFAFKGTGRNSIELQDGEALLKGCGLKKILVLGCQLKTLFLQSNDAVDWMNSISAGNNLNGYENVCVPPRTQIQPKPNCDCSELFSDETNTIFSLTGTAKTFAGENLSGNLHGFVLNKNSFPLNQEIYSDSSSYSFSDGFFNFSFGESIFPSMKLTYGPFELLNNLDSLLSRIKAE